MLACAFANQIGFVQRPTQALDTQIHSQQVVTLEMPTINRLLLSKVPGGINGDLVKTYLTTILFKIPDKEKRRLLYQTTVFKGLSIKHASRFHLHLIWYQ